MASPRLPVLAPRRAPVLDARLGRAYFAVQCLLGLAWWIGVFTTPWIREATLGGLDPVVVAAFDLPLFVVASGLAAVGRRPAVRVVVVWTVVVAAGLAVYATVTGLAGWGALLMIASAAAGIAAGALVLFDRLPAERILVGPFAFRPATGTSTDRHVRQTVGQVIVFWSFFLGVVPAVILLLERRWSVGVSLPLGVRAAGFVLLLLFSALGIWSALAMARNGEGTPLPSASTRRLVVVGPYQHLRNPMALAGVAQGMAVGLILGSWLVVVYALCGSLVWNWLVRPLEEADLAERLGAPYLTYRDQVRCWVPRWSPFRAP
ncbi:methyltransferase family protein [Oerskovia flava]|uniref:methyltransferase family protein n=1 Tax=Oerskovia flava TaxID=2986422 RepID=UPI00223FF525|nr:isoprenylcysteine carboxylmethyltransferase family protein [Oerskovia sp. JB1-3-2]